MKSFKSLEHWSPSRWEIELSNGVLNIQSGISEKYLPTQPTPGALVQTGLSGQIFFFFFDLQLWPLISLYPLDQNQPLVPHIKDLCHVCLETKGQGYWKTFKVYNLSSNFNRAYVVKVWTFLVTAVHNNQNCIKG